MLNCGLRDLLSLKKTLVTEATHCADNLLSGKGKGMHVMNINANKKFFSCVKTYITFKEPSELAVLCKM